jgi:hypothetical protein
VARPPAARAAAAQASREFAAAFVWQAFGRRLRELAQEACR